MNCNSKVKEENEGYMQVAIRIKPLDGNKKTCLQYIPDSNQIEVNKEYGTENFKRYFSFDYIFGPSTTQETIYNQLCPPLINHFLDGINITVFAYGQTGTGKTYTMGSETSSLNPEESIGIIPRVIQGLYNGIEQKKKENNEIEYVVKITFIEIYQEQLRDLLHPDTLSKDINIWENNNCITVSGVQEEIVNNLDEILTYIEQGTVARMTGTTNVHLHSSRSHAIFTIILEQYLKQRSKENNNNNVFESINNMQNSNLIRMSKFHLVDLAGSERVKKTGAEGLRLKESVKINSGLLALGNVISSLSMESSNNNNSNNNEKYIPYRDSKLTRLLQDSLGGNSKLILI
ncbi:kinesin-domain-containing protein [Neocallimastix californiae]|uniref:Kinesin-like protein n=1 Tax=Neocallimastix californiae TaxID=1754190 RepID=A0A1Y2B2Z7_9FUNG|nr:kinesin-domain-containing protein [Neocallimastix californiae]|eukprot:ORY29191.1 kinesin-domain-containing protein [Neocallimastix californiae]